MNRVLQERRKNVAAGGLVVGAAFLGGAVLGGLVFLLCFAMSPVADGPSASGGPLLSGAAGGDSTVSAPAPVTEAVSTNAWGSAPPLVNPVVLETGGLPPSRSGTRAVGGGDSGASDRGSADALVRRAGLAMILVLLGMQAWAWALLRASRRSKAELELRLLRLEQAPTGARQEVDWLANLDRDLDGEWDDGP